MHFAKKGETWVYAPKRTTERQKGKDRKSRGEEFRLVHEVIMPLRRSDKQCNAATC